MSKDVDVLIEKVGKCESLDEGEMKFLCSLVGSILFEESNCRYVNSPQVVCGDVHGQFHDLLKLFRTGGDIKETNYIFMGDLVDRGYNSLETLTYLMLLKVKYPERLTIIRGNHESRQITQIYGFYDECRKKYGNAEIYRKCCEVFDLFCISACIDGKIFCVHGGLSPSIKSIDQIGSDIQRRREVPNEGGFCDLLWSDPESSMETWAMSPRGAGYLFGSKTTKEFCWINDLELVTRAHQLVMEGFKYHFPEKNLVTVWSAPNYCYRCGNLASVLMLDEKLDRHFKVFSEVYEHHVEIRKVQQGTVRYFL